MEALTIRHVLCAIDFSETSARAVEQASAVAGWFGAPLTILHVVAGNPEPAHDEATTFVSHLLDDATADILVEVGQPTAVILERARALPADLLVMGTHGVTGFQRLLLGSVTENVLRHATCPVLTVPPRAHVVSKFSFGRILCAVDFADWCVPAVQLASTLAERSGATLDLLHVIEWPWHEPPAPAFADLPVEQATALREFRRYIVTSAGKRLETLVTDVVSEGLAVTTNVCHGKPYVEILRVAEDSGADLIVLGVHGRNPMDLTIFGSTANHVVRSARCPVLTLRR